MASLGDYENALPGAMPCHAMVYAKRTSFFLCVFLLGRKSKARGLHAVQGTDRDPGSSSGGGDARAICAVPLARTCDLDLRVNLDLRAFLECCPIISIIRVF